MQPVNIPRCYDSHVHFLATGQVARGLNLRDLKFPEDYQKIALSTQFHRGPWLYGFGWDQNQWANTDLPTAEMLDQLFPEIPVFFNRADGHVAWLNTAGLKQSGYFQVSESQRPTPAGGKILRDSFGYPTGIFFDSAKIEIELGLPPYEASQIKDDLKAATRIFNQNGFTHVRDMTCSESQWQQMVALDDSQDLTVYIESHFVCEGFADWQRCLGDFKYAQKNFSTHLKAAGIKLFVDGALGSEGAFLSQPYENGGCGGLCWPESEITQIIRHAWSEQIPIAVHTIGDAAVDFVACSALKLKDQFPTGRIAFEHAEIIRPQTIPTIRSLGAQCYMQPSHFLSDCAWLQKKVGSLYPFCFPWQQLDFAGVPVFFGSDSPIEPPHLELTLRGLNESRRNGVPKWNREWWRGHQHPDPTWGPNCLTRIESDKISVTFDSKVLF